MSMCQSCHTFRGRLSSFCSVCDSDTLSLDEQTVSESWLHEQQLFHLNYAHFSELSSNDRIDLSFESHRDGYPQENQASQNPRWITISRTYQKTQ